MDKTKTFRFNNLNNFKKKFRKIEPKLKDKKIKFELNLIDFFGTIKFDNTNNVLIYVDDEFYGAVLILDIFELKMYIPTENGAEECYIIKSEEVE